MKKEPGPYDFKILVQVGDNRQEKRLSFREIVTKMMEKLQEFGGSGIKDSV
jgi:hypothetical protein